MVLSLRAGRASGNPRADGKRAKTQVGWSRAAGRKIWCDGDSRGARFFERWSSGKASAPVHQQTEGAGNGPRVCGFGLFRGRRGRGGQKSAVSMNSLCDLGSRAPLTSAEFGFFTVSTTLNLSGTVLPWTAETPAKSLQTFPIGLGRRQPTSYEPETGLLFTATRERYAATSSTKTVPTGFSVVENREKTEFGARKRGSRSQITQTVH